MKEMRKGGKTGLLPFTFEMNENKNRGGKIGIILFMEKAAEKDEPHVQRMKTQD